MPKRRHWGSGARWSSGELRVGPFAGGKPRYSVCLRTGRAKSPDLSCLVHAAAQRDSNVPEEKRR